jgi:hypothetical protein
MFKEPTILFQYKATEKLATLLSELKIFFENNSKQTLFDFFDIDNASGLWLNQLGNFLNLPRPFIVNDNIFICDSSLMDGDDLLDSEALAPDDVYRTYIKANLLKRNSRFTIENIIDLLQFATGADKVYIAETVKTVSIYLGVSNEDQKRISNLLNSLDRKWFGLPSGVRLGEFKVVVLPDNTNFFVMDSSPMDNPNFVMI